MTQLFLCSYDLEKNSLELFILELKEQKDKHYHNCRHLSLFFAKCNSKTAENIRAN